MFKVGDKVFYPMHGAGVVKAIEEIEVLGENKQYYNIHIPMSHMDVKIPCDNIGKLHIRPALESEKVSGILRVKRDEKTVDAKREWSERIKAYSEKMLSGEMEVTFEIVRNLVLLSEEKTLNATEREMLNNARKLLISELTVIKEISEGEAADLLEQTS